MNKLTITITGVLVLFITTALAPDSKCTATGNATDEKEKALNILKNRTEAVNPVQIDHAASIDGLYNSKDDSTLFRTDYGATIEGYLFTVEAGKGESCNCDSTADKYVNYYLYISKDEKAKRNRDCILAAVTPASRQMHPQWTLKYLKSLLGKRVVLNGWLVYDFPHIHNSFSTSPNGPQLDRHTVWEIFPVTSLRSDE